MKRLVAILPAFFALFLFSGCLKDEAPRCTNKTVDSERAQMIAYAFANNISYTEDPSGLFYQITNPGTGATPNNSSKVYITYTAKLVSNNNTFDSKADPLLTGWTLGTLVYGWQLGLPLIKKGGSIKLIVPSSLAYGCQGFQAVPPDAITYFEITLADVQ